MWILDMEHNEVIFLALKILRWILDFFIFVPPWFNLLAKELFF